MRFRQIAMLAAASLVALVTSARADTITLALVGGAPTPVSGGYFYTYGVIATFNQLHDGDYFVLYDFAGYQSGTLVLSSTLLSSGFTGDATQTDGPTPFAQNHTDDPSIPDFVFTYHGPDTGDITGLTLGAFGAVSTYNYDPSAPLFFSAQDHKYFAFTGETGQQGNTGTVNGPVASSPASTPMPLPAAAWGGMSLMGVLGGLRAIRRRTQA